MFPRAFSENSTTRTISVRTAFDVEPKQRISVGCDAIDAITNGGIPLNGLSEIVGSGGVGKTQLCLQLAIAAQLPEHLGGMGKAVVYVSSETLFPSRRLNQLLRIFRRKYKSLLENAEDNIVVTHVFEYDSFQTFLFKELPRLVHYREIGLVIVDSIAGIFRSENIIGNYVKRSQDFTELTSKLRELSKEKNFAVVCVNQVADNIDSGETQPCLGLSWSNNITHRFWIRRFENSNREFSVEFSPDLPQSRTIFQITCDGLV